MVPLGLPCFPAQMLLSKTEHLYSLSLAHIPGHSIAHFEGLLLGFCEASIAECINTPGPDPALFVLADPTFSRAVPGPGAV